MDDQVKEVDRLQDGDHPQEGCSPIRVIGVGGAGCNAVERMMQVGIPGVSFIAANTDSQALNLNQATQQVLLGPTTTRGRGTGGDPSLGAKAAEESRRELEKILAGSEILFLAAGLGGGTGSGASPLVAEIASSLGATVIAVVSQPFAFEGARRRGVAQESFSALTQAAHTLIAIPNDRLVEVIAPETPLEVAFSVADDLLRQGVQGIAEIVTKPGLINLDLAHLKMLLARPGAVFMAMGQGEGQEKVSQAVESALANPLTSELSILGAHEVLVHISGGPDLSLSDVRDAVEAVAQAAGPAAEITMGTAISLNLEGKMQCTVVAVGMQEAADFLSPAASSILDGSGFTEPGRFFLSADSNLDVPAFIRRRKSLEN